MSNPRYSDYKPKSLSSYKTLEKTTCYSCPCYNQNYKDFHGGINCLCSMQMQRSSMDKMMLSGKLNKNLKEGMSKHFR